MSVPRALFAYYRDCVVAESRTDAVYEAGHPAIALLTEGREPAVSSRESRSVQVPAPAAVWASEQLSAARPEPVSCGYPLAVARRGGRLVVAPLFSRECQLVWGPAGPELHAVDAPIEGCEQALALLGWEREERTAWLEEQARAPVASYGDAVRRAARAGVGVAALDPSRLCPLPRPGTRPAVANTAMLYLPQSALAARGVVAELDQLEGAHDRHLRRGPLGVLLGTRRLRDRPPRPEPLPVVLPSNLAQDRALESARRSRLTVVTGPPGTGKSQVLVNAVASTLLDGGTVLFTSRTNRAVDVVFERLQELPGGTPVRAGRTAHRVQAAELIRRTLAQPAGPPDEHGHQGSANAGLAGLAGLGQLTELATERRRAHDLWLAAFTAAEAVSAPANARDRADAAVRRLALLPPDDALRARLAGYESARVAAGRELWQLAWNALGGRAPRQARAGAAALAHHLELGRPLGATGDYRAGLRAFPVWGLTNLAAAACLPLASDLFDLVIIDEASQCDIASALPLLARARRALIIGDPQQLAHVSRLSAAREEGIARRHGIGADQLTVLSQRARSLYDIAATRSNGPPLLLDEHYRCHPRVIAFANERLYSNRLTIRTSPVPEGGVFWRDIAGSFGRGARGHSVCNAEEAAAVVEQLAAERRARPELAIGVVAPFRAQVDLIRDLAMRNDRGAPDASLTIDTVHRFQGDERDVMLLSPTVCASTPHFFRGVAGQPRLLNVAITRARHRLVVVGDREACLATGGLLAELAAYAAPIRPDPFTEITEARGRASPAGDHRRHRPAPGQPS